MSQLEVSNGINDVLQKMESRKTKMNSKYENEENYANIESLPYLQAALFATVLEDVIMELRILIECNNEIRVIKTLSDMPLLLTKKYEVAEPEIIDELEGIDERNLGCKVYQLKKLDQDRKHIITAITSTYIDLIQHKTLKALKDKVNSVINLDKYRSDLFEMESKNRVLRRELNKQLRQQRNHIKSAVYDSNNTIDVLRSGVDDANLYAEIKYRYVDHWQQARTEQHHQTICDVESVPTTIIDSFKQRIESEQRVHSELELLNNISINETLEKVEVWMTRYDKDMESIDLKIQIQKNDFYNMLDKRNGLEELIDKHDALIKEWLNFKEEREKARLYKEKMTNSAIIVQAWWRGLLVRRQLGPYKIPKKKGGQKK